MSDTNQKLKVALAQLEFCNDVINGERFAGMDQNPEGVRDLLYSAIKAVEVGVEQLMKGRDQATVSPVEVDEREGLQDKIEGLEADLDSAVEVAFKRGAVEWVKMNYPKHYQRLASTPSSQSDLPLDALIVFGLEAQGHIPTIEVMLAEGSSWQEIGRRIHWDGETAKAYYERYLSRRSSSLKTNSVVTDEAVRRAARAIWQTWQEHKKSEASWEDAEAASHRPHDLPLLYEAHALALDEARAALMAGLSTPAKNAEWQAHDLMPGLAYESIHFGIVKYLGIDTYYGEKTHAFEVGRMQRRYWKTEKLGEFLKPKSEPIPQTNAVDPVGYLKPRSEWAEEPYFVYANDRKQEWMTSVFTVPVYNPAPQSNVEIRETLKRLADQANRCLLRYSDNKENCWDLAPVMTGLKDCVDLAYTVLGTPAPQTNVRGEDEVIEAMVLSLRNPFPSESLTRAGGIDRWREIMRDAYRAAIATTEGSDNG